jgi:hypothetical protein
VGSNRIVEGKAAFEGLERRQPACVGEDCNVEPRNELEMGTEACRLKTILGWAQIIERRSCEKVVWPIGLLGSRFRAFDCTCQEKPAYGHVAYAVEEVSKTVSKEAQNGTLCPGNERCSVIHWNRPKNAVMPCQVYLETHR